MQDKIRYTTMTIKNHAIFWSLTAAAFIATIAIFKSVLLPFVLGIVIAYLLNPWVEGLQRIKLSRRLSVLTILLLFLMFVGVLLAVLIPILYREALQFSQEAPYYVKYLTQLAQPHIEKFQTWMGAQSNTDLQTLIGNHAGSAAEIARRTAQSIASGGQAFISFISILVITPIVAYFMMVEFPNITKWVEDLIPRHSRTQVMNILKEINKKLSGFIRGQISVAVILGLAYAIALSIAGLKYGFLIGLSAGLLSIIPMVGSTLGLLVGIGVAWFQAGTWGYVGLIAAIFLFGQIIEGNILTPKLVGGSVGLHPLWIFFALLAGGSLFGILGMLLAVPVAAVVSVLLAFAITQYKKSPYYRKEAKVKKKKSSATNKKEKT